MSLRTFIYGSCVSRDTFERLPDEFELINYVARQSLVSAFTPPTSRALPHIDTDSAFQRRMITGDWESSLVGQLREHANSIDVLLWDLCDERVGLRRLERVTQRPKMHAWATRSVDTIRTEVDAQLEDAPRVPFASATHRVLFLHAVRRFRLLLDDLGLRDRTLLLAPAWATQTKDGQSVPTSFGLGPVRANRLFKDYHRTAEQIVGVTMLTADDVFADSRHSWGLAPFHYSEDVYRSLGAQVIDASRLRTSAGGGQPVGPSAQVPTWPSPRDDETHECVAVADLVQHLVANPKTLWSDDKAHLGERQMAITKRFMEKNSVTASGTVARELLRASRARSQNRPVTFFLAGPTSAGCHLLQQVLARSQRMKTCTEAYLPPPILDAATCLSTEARWLLLDAIHLLHANEPLTYSPQAPLINVGQIRVWSHHELMPEPKKLVVLLQDPLDVVLARTFERQTLRRRHFANEDDETYLRRNISFINRFYEFAQEAAADAVVRYEELRADTVATMNKLGEPLGSTFAPITADDANGPRTSTSAAESTRDAVTQDLMDITITELAALRRGLGYFSPNHLI